MWRNALIAALLTAPLCLLAIAAPAAGDHAAWYLARATGLTAYGLLWLDLMLGLAMPTRLGEILLARWRAFDLHQFTALLATGVIVVHLAALLADHYIGFSLVELLVPLASPYRPAWTALGVIAFYLVLVVTGSWWARRWIGQRAWRVLHYLALPVYLLTLGHGLLAGADSGQWWGGAFYGATAAPLALLMAWRFLAPASWRLRSAPTRAPAARPERIGWHG